MMWTGLSPFQQRLLDQLAIPAPKVPVQVCAGETLSVRRTADGWHVALPQESLVGRAAVLLAENADAADGFCLEETPAFHRLGVMLDCSRNAVPRPETLRRLLRILCRMGYQTVQLYMEDVYELEGYPYFGYGRGRYTCDELRALDEYAAGLGIELVPAIQTLAHLGQALKWRAMKPLVDTGDILLIDSPAVTDFITAMFRTMRRCFSTKRINIGMDEAHMVGLGRYLDEHGYTNRTELMLRHFRLVHDIAVEHGFAPMLWSDMFFRLAAGGEYYAPKAGIDPSVAASIPDDTTLIYWDYYSLDPAIYDGMLDAHAKLCPRTLFAGGAWKWSGFAPCNRFSFRLTDLAAPACRRHHVQEVLITMWGDNGAECSPFAVLPALQYWAEHNYASEVDEAALKRRFSLCTGGDWDQLLLADEMVFTPDNPAPGRMAVNATKTLLYQDLLLPLCSTGMDLEGYSAQLDKLLPRLQAAAQEGEWKTLLSEQAALCAVLRDKSRLTARLHAAWQAKDRAALAALASRELPALRAVCAEFSRAFRRRWLEENRAAGLDVFDIRIGGLLRRIEVAAQLLRDWLDGRIDTIEELDTTPLPFDPAEAEKGHLDVGVSYWHEIATPCSMVNI